MDVEQLIKYSQYFGFGGAQVINSLLLFLLFKRANSSFGRYRILMIVFSIYAMIYSLIEILTFPVMFCQGRSLCVCSDGPFAMYRPIGIPLTALYCGCFAMCISLLALHFYYRYIAVCKPDKLYYFDGKRIIITLIPCLVFFAAWTGNVFFLMYPDDEKEDVYHDVLLNYFNVNSYHVSFISMLYKSPDLNGRAGHWNPSQLVAISICSVIMNVCFSMIIYCGYKALKQMKNCGVVMSAKTKELNRQLFMTLGMQTLLPLITMYIPVGCFIFLPLFGIQLGVNANKTGAFIGLYPALDPLVAIFLIKDFRNYVFCTKHIRSTISVSNVHTTKHTSTIA